MAEPLAPCTHVAVQSKRDWLLVSLVAAAATAPFLGKAFHIDDVLYLQVAERIRLTPMDPYGGVVLWDAKDGEPARLFATDFNPPLWKYALAAIIRLAGPNEYALHGLSACCCFGMAFALYCLSCRWTRHPVWCVTAVVLGPFYLPGQNIMLEPPMACLGLWGVELWLRSEEHKSVVRAWIAGFLLAAAVAVKYTAGPLLLVLAANELFTRRDGLRTSRYVGRWLCLFAPTAVVLAAWVIHNRLHYGSSHVGLHGYALGALEPLARIRAVVRTIGAVAVFCLPLLASRAVLLTKGQGRLAVVIGVSWAAFDLFSVRHTTQLQGWLPSELEQAHFALFAWNGAVALVGLALALSRWWNARTMMLPALWATTYLTFNALSVPFVAPRHLLFFLTPAVWLLSSAWDRSRDSSKGGSSNGVLRGLTLAASSILGLWLASADFHASGHYRDLARFEVARLAAAKTRTVWFTGTWGFAFYATQAGGFPVVSRPESYGMPMVRGGDLVVHPALLNWGDLEGFRKKLPPLELIEHHQYPTSNPLRTIGPNINYYAVQGYSLPWCFFVRMLPHFPWATLPPLDDVMIYRIH